MGEFVKGECPHCGQSIEYPAEGTGQVIPCPTCQQAFALKPLPPAALKVSILSPVSAPAAPSAPTTPLPDQAGPASLPPELPAAYPTPPADQPRPASLKPKLPGAQPTPPLAPPPPKASVSAAQTSAPPADLAEKPAPKPRAASPPATSPFDRACAEFEGTRELAGGVPTREQLARAWALVKYRKENQNELPSHAELVVALKEIFKDFRSSKSSSSGARPDKAS